MGYHTSSFAAGVICIWLSVWAIRKKADVDYKLDSTSQLLRWALVVVGFLVAHLPGSSLGYVRVGGYVVGLAFLCWPNFAYHLTHLVHRDDAVQRVL